MKLTMNHCDLLFSIVHNRTGCFTVKSEQRQAQNRQIYRNTISGICFLLSISRKKIQNKIPQKSLDKVMKKVRKLTSRKWSVSNSYKTEKIAKVVRGQINYFKIGSILTATRKLDTVIRYRFRMCIWKYWKKPKPDIRIWQRV